MHEHVIFEDVRQEPARRRVGVAWADDGRLRLARLVLERVLRLAQLLQLLQWLLVVGRHCQQTGDVAAQELVLRWGQPAQKRPEESPVPTGLLTATTRGG